MEKVKLFEMFSGYGGARWALKKAKIQYESIGYSEIKPHAIKCYDTNFPNTKNWGDCTKIITSELPDFNLLCAGFPCQDVSLAGRRNLSKGRTNLYKEIIRIIKDKKPKYLVLENVKGLLSMGKKEYINETLFSKILKELKLSGYGVIYKVLNSKDYGIPQNRERIFFICKYGGWDFMEFNFPEKVKLTLLLQDLLQPDEDINDKYYLTKKQLDSALKRGTIRDKPFNKSIDRLYSYCLTTKNPKSDILNSTIIHSKFPRSGDPSKGGTGHLSKTDNVSYCVDTGNSQFIESDGRYRVLTPREVFRLMGFVDDIDLTDLSDTKKYNLAGDGWDINLVSKIFKKLFKKCQIER